MIIPLNNLPPQVVRFLAENAGTPAYELAPIADGEAADRAGAATQLLITSGIDFDELLAQVAELIALAKSYREVARRLRALAA
jgi:hypothetical protein